VKPFLDLVDLASERLGGSVILALDEFFAAKENLIRAEPPVFREGEYTDRGKWMDGWETRRRREDFETGDWCVVRLGARGIVRAVDVETTFFEGNYPEACAIAVCDVESAPDSEMVDAFKLGPKLGLLPFPFGSIMTAPWKQILPKTPLKGDTHNVFEIADAPPATHVNLTIFPDGGVARLRIYGEVVPDWPRLKLRGDVDLAGVEHGGVVVACSDMFFGSRHNLIMPGEARNMGEGWETKRRRGGGHDWTIVKLGAKGTVRRVEVDTRHFKGNAPGACSLEGCVADSPAFASLESADWREIFGSTVLQPDARQMFEDTVREIGPVTHVRLNIFPDGGIARLRVFGRLA